uniref:N-acylneuraminate cytidylyltransferase n=1 Tax=Candidatus Kentrum sp. MB TaxID=2138164 RepID=A0A450XEN4_9GAMM|nr:MAG: N-acylneuraminate cytidylyltransferase [Candidatus Kentron sp. MB]VFK30248.1 MAG: N-acylneuraminate cytidylyltransferase [Candidatus Kentron sp. MB]VFK75150.1 MAG: N-acylneuraminate cytidylyltransferase [Candidatus Kentron sp. MB]
MNIAIIPARGGSKRILRKNIRDFCGKPMIAWSITAAQESGLFDCIIVSTDDKEIADIAKVWGAEIPFRRPAELANDNIGTTEVVAHATHWLRDRQWPIDIICCLYATAPFVRVEDMRLGLETLQSGAWAYTFTATEYAAPIFRSFQAHPQGGVEMFFPEHFDKRSQDLPVALHDAGQFYWGWTDSWLAQKRLFEQHSCAIIIPNWRVQDIDTEDDWRRAELLYKILN